MSALPPDRAPIFILGIRPRSGTHFLQDLLCLHPDCAPARINEDYFMDEARWLRRFASAAATHWKVSHRVHAPALLPYLGQGLLGFLAQDAGGKRVVTKTPTVNGLANLHTVFPDAAVIILVRDGRNVVESGHRSFKWPYERSMYHFATAARKIIAYQARPASQQARRWLLVRYEDLVLNLRPELERILACVELDAASYDFSAAEALPVRGSSDLRAQAGGGMHWRPVEKTPDFNPLQRWHTWPRARLERYNWMAGPAAAGLGYPPHPVPGGPLARLGWRLWNQAQDARLGAFRMARRFKKMLGRMWRERRREPA